MEALQKIFPILDRAKPLGARTLPNGTRLIGHVPHVAPEAWLHEIFPPLHAHGIEAIERGIKRALPQDFKTFLEFANGLMLFSCSLSIYGFRTNYSRTGDDAIQPFDIITPNTYERPKDALPSYVFIGGYRSDGSLIYIDSDTSKVFRSARKRSIPLNEWTNLEEMLVTETIRIALLFDDRGKRIDPRESTAP